MKELKTPEINEVKKPELEGFKEIKPEKGTGVEEAKIFWNDEFKNSDRVQSHDSQVDGPKEYFDHNGEKYREGDKLEPNKEIEKNGYTYKTDELGRVISAEGKLQIKDHKGRNEMPDSRDTVAQGKMKDSDDRGHLIADRFNGSGELENLVPMDGKLNKGDYQKLENTLAEAVNDGADVRLKVEPVYSNDSNRPSEFRVSYGVDGERETIIFKNERGD